MRARSFTHPFRWRPKVHLPFGGWGAHGQHFIICSKELAAWWPQITPSYGRKYGEFFLTCSRTRHAGSYLVHLISPRPAEVVVELAHGDRWHSLDLFEDDVEYFLADVGGWEDVHGHNFVSPFTFYVSAQIWYTPRTSR